jgi:hypothetical protein
LIVTRSCLTHHSMSVNACSPSFEDLELKGVMYVEFLFDRRIHESQLKDRIALQIFRLEALIMLFGEHRLTGALFFMQVCDGVSH